MCQNAEMAARLFLNERMTSVHECSANVIVSGSMSSRGLIASEVGSLWPYIDV